MRIFKINEATAFFGITMENFNSKNEEGLSVCQDSETILSIALIGFEGEIPIGTPFYARGKAHCEKANCINIDMKISCLNFQSL